jgi:signal transduction histidine kinase
LFPFGTRDGLFWRVYLYGVLFLALSLLIVLVTLVLEQSRRPELLLSREALGQLTALVENPTAMQRALDGLSREEVHVSAYRWDGTLIGSNARAPLPPLGDTERARVRNADSVLVQSYGQPLMRNGRPLGYVVLQGGAGQGVSFGRLALVLLGVLLVAGFAGLPAARALTAPLEKLTRTVRALGAGDLAVRSGIRRKDEVGELAFAFDEMAEHLERLVRSEKELLANISHELRTPISRLRLALEVAELDPASLDAAQLQAMATDLAELEQLIEDVIITARLDASARAPAGLPPLKRAPVDPEELLREATTRFLTAHPRRQLVCEVSSPLPRVEADAVLLRRVIDNLLDNARKYSDEHEAVRLLAVSEGNTLRIEVRDRGIGMHQADIQKLFTPFFRTDRSRARGTGGVGLGLALARRIVEAHGGQMAVESMEGLGTVVRLRLPVHKS